MEFENFDPDEDIWTDYCIDCGFPFGEDEGEEGICYSCWGERSDRVAVGLDLII